MITLINWTPIIQWYIDTCYDEIGLCAQIMLTNLGSRFNDEHKSKGLVCDCLKGIKMKNLHLASQNFCIHLHI